MPGDDNVQVAVNRLLEAVSGGDRVWNPYAKGLVRSEFKKRIEKAERGQLVPVDEVKPVEVWNPPPLYEIRWLDIHVTERSKDGIQTYLTVQVRMYHSEPAQEPEFFIGHHVHEKRLDVDDINAAQQEEIQAAVKWYALGEPENWGIATKEQQV